MGIGTKRGSWSGPVKEIEIGESAPNLSRISTIPRLSVVNFNIVPRYLMKNNSQMLKNASSGG
jgi:hypothetical protein